MSIIHEIPEKATRDEVPWPVVEVSKKIRFATPFAFLLEVFFFQPSFPDPSLNDAFSLERAGYFEESKRQYQTFLELATRQHEPAVQLAKTSRIVSSVSL